MGMENLSTIDDVCNHSQQSHVDAERDPAPEYRGWTRHPREQGPQDLWLALLVLDFLLDVQLLQGSIVCAFEQSCAFRGVGVTGVDCLFDNDVQLVGYDLEWRSILQADEEG